MMTTKMTTTGGVFFSNNQYPNFFLTSTIFLYISPTFVFFLLSNLCSCWRFDSTADAT